MSVRCFEGEVPDIDGRKCGLYQQTNVLTSRCKENRETFDELEGGDVLLRLNYSSDAAPTDYGPVSLNETIPEWMSNRDLDQAEEACQEFRQFKSRE
ncbi:hypothetical protein KIN20_025132 [Parelaphostrongylus tenuis]|uniref:Uncharacterized protein n=1 Tax=Parelaphostrongylus tenuis TaxID=148309 RepID=A0AAD5MUP8_PARTN|nr:hypothetical protein KIN20_025132 [Parelaphostrongylus tenuis]